MTAAVLALACMIAVRIPHTFRMDRRRMEAGK